MDAYREHPPRRTESGLVCACVDVHTHAKKKTRLTCGTQIIFFSYGQSNSGYLSSYSNIYSMVIKVGWFDW